MSAFTSNPENVCIHKSGWQTLPSGVEITRVPLWDKSTSGFARLGHAVAYEWCEEHGMRMATAAEIREMWSMPSTTYITPYTMPTMAMLNADGINTSSQSEIDRYRNAHMMSFEWCNQHDRVVLQMAEDEDWDEIGCLANAGKHWVSPAGTIFGWLKPDGLLIQNESRFHASDGTYVDYATTVHAVKVDYPDIEDPKPTEPGGPVVSRGTLGQAVLEQAMVDFGNNVREDLGRNDGHRIREYLAPWNLKPPQNWCSVAVAAWLRQACELHGLEQPIAGSPGAQATMAQLKKAGLWVAASKITDDDLQPGNIVVWRRPPATWTGHIGLLERMSGGEMVCIEGNSGSKADRVARMRRRLDDPLLLGIGRLDGFEGFPVPVEHVPAVEIPHSGSDPLDLDADNLFSRWLGLDVLADPVSSIGYVDDEPQTECTGLDISSWQKPSSLHWDEIKKKHRFVICRATYGTKVDTTFHSHCENISKHDLTLGAYHFLRTSQDLDAQMEAFIREIESVGYGASEILPVIDIEKNQPYDEWDPSKMMDYAHHMAAELADRFGGVIIYTNPNVDAVLGKPKLFRSHHVWIAHYGVSSPRWDGEWTMWQSSGSHQGPEADGPLDFNFAKKLPLCD